MSSPSSIAADTCRLYDSGKIREPRRACKVEDRRGKDALVDAHRLAGGAGAIPGVLPEALVPYPVFCAITRGYAPRRGLSSSLIVLPPVAGGGRDFTARSSQGAAPIS